jgi:hypothetical protein
MSIGRRLHAGRGSNFGNRIKLPILDQQMTEIRQAGFRIVRSSIEPRVWSVFEACVSAAAGTFLGRFVEFRSGRSSI